MVEELFDGTLAVNIPDTYQEMQAELINEWYPYEDRPDIIKVNEDSTRFFTFSLLENEVIESQIKNAIHAVADIIRSLYPSSFTHEPETLTLDVGECGWFAFQTMDDGKAINNVMYVFSLYGAMVLGTIGYPLGEQEGEEEMMNIMKSLSCITPKRLGKKI